jgi:hypothetical protein
MDSKLAAGIALVQKELDKIDDQIAEELKTSTSLQRQIAGGRQEQQRLAGGLSEQRLQNIRLASEKVDLQVALGIRQRQKEEAARLRQTLKVRWALGLLPLSSTCRSSQPCGGSQSVCLPSVASPLPRLLQDDVAQATGQLEALAALLEASSASFCSSYSLEQLNEQVAGIKDAEQELRGRLKALVVQFRQRRQRAEARQQRAEELRGARDAVQQEVQGAWPAQLPAAQLLPHGALLLNAYYCCSATQHAGQLDESSPPPFQTYRRGSHQRRSRTAGCWLPARPTRRRLACWSACGLTSAARRRRLGWWRPGAQLNWTLLLDMMHGYGGRL